MNIAMFTNTYVPHVGGVANSVKSFSDEYRKEGHRVLVIAPEFKHIPPDEKDVLRIPAIQNFNGSDFSVSLPISMLLSKRIEHFKPDIIHSHHPYLLGDTALRMATSLNTPLIFTHHTMYEQYTHYVPLDSPRLQHFILELSTGYANLCNHVIAPSESTAAILRRRGVKTPITVIPTGVEISRFEYGDGASIRSEMKIPLNALVIGYTGRLAQEKNLEFWAHTVARFLNQVPSGHALIIGDGPFKKMMGEVFSLNGVESRLHFTGTLSGKKLVNAYYAMDIFVFTSKSETQGMVLTEAMAAGLPVVALNAPGIREILRDFENGRLIEEESIEAFVQAMYWIISLDSQKLSLLKEEAKNTAQTFSLSHCVSQALDLYQHLLRGKYITIDFEQSAWFSILRRIEEEWCIWSNRFSAAGKAVLSRAPEEQDQTSS
ncbi:MAG: glycosyltransferase [bacterium]